MTITIRCHAAGDENWENHPLLYVKCSTEKRNSAFACCSCFVYQLFWKLCIILINHWQYLRIWKPVKGFELKVFSNLFIYLIGWLVFFVLFCFLFKALSSKKKRKKARKENHKVQKTKSSLSKPSLKKTRNLCRITIPWWPRCASSTRWCISRLHLTEVDFIM